MAPAVLRALFFIGIAGCAAAPPRVEARRPPPPCALVLVVDGAANSQTTRRALTAAITAQDLPLALVSFDWNHGPGRGLADVTDAAHARTQGYRLAAQVQAYRAAAPGLPIYLVAHSAGSMVALAAADALPRASVERLVLLAPDVAADFDLRRALTTARQGVDVFTSERDRFWLGFGTHFVGTLDGKRGIPAAGRVGFAPPSDPALACRLHQHPWDPSLLAAGNRGDHDGALAPTYLRAYILPLLLPTPRW